jgi:hypothetical protein
MTATYNDTLPTDLDRARSLIGDTDMTNALMSDEHVEAVLGYKGSLNAAVAYLATELVARFAKSPIRKSATGISVDYTENLKLWRQIAGDATAQEAGGSISFIPANYTGDEPTDEFSRPPWPWP